MILLTILGIQDGSGFTPSLPFKPGQNGYFAIPA